MLPSKRKLLNNGKKPNSNRRDEDEAVEFQRY